MGEDDEDMGEPEVIDLSDEEWTPNKKQRTETVKHHRCTICNASYTNLSLFMAHLSRHKQVDKPKLTPAGVPLSTKSSLNNNATENFSQDIKFKCGCCSESFSNKESLALHMHLHTGPQLKSKVVSVPANVVTESIRDANSAVNRPDLNRTVEASTLFEDIEQLSQPDIPPSAGVCSEEQKGRVCLLALLNNGVCSDITHRAPVEYQMPSESNVVSTISKVNNSSEQQTISITVSIPSVINGRQSTEQQLSFSAISDHSNSTNILYPLSLPKQPVIENLTVNSSSHQPVGEMKKLEENDSCQNFAIAHHSGLGNSSLDMPDLLGSSCPDVQEVTSQTVNKSLSPSITKNLKERDTLSGWNGSNSDVTPKLSMSSSRSVQDMPSLLDEDLIESGRQRPENFVQITDACHLQGDEVVSVVTQSICRSKSSINQDEEINAVVQAKPSSPLGSDHKDIPDSVGNIAIVNVTSVQMNRDSFDAETIATDWFYSSPSKDAVPDMKEVKEVTSSLQESWLSDGNSNSMPVSDKNLLNETFNSSEYSISGDSCSTPRRIVGEESNITEEQETRSKISSLV